MDEDIKAAGKEKLQSGFRGFIQKVGEVIEDAASLEVTTFTGNFTYKAQQLVHNGVDKVEINKVLKSLTVDNNTDLTLVAYTKVSIDSDVNTIVKSNLSESDAEILKLHKEMMQSSKDSRTAIVDMVLKLVNIL